MIRCEDCPYLVKKEELSLVSRMMGYTSECSQTGVLFNIHDYNEDPDWCPLNRDEKKAHGFEKHG